MNEITTHIVDFDNGDKLIIVYDLYESESCFKLYEVNCGKQSLVDTFSDRLDALYELAWRVGIKVVYGRTLITHYSD